MFKPIWQAIAGEFSANAAYDETAEIFRRDRLSTATAYASTADYCATRMRELGLVDVEKVSFKADGRTLLGDWIPSPAWDAEEAELAILEPAELAGRLCRYPDDPACLGMNSGATPREGIVVPLVDADRCRNPRSLAGKAVLTNQRPRVVRERYARLGVSLSDWKPGNEDFERRHTEPGGTYWENVWHEPWDRPRLPVFKIPPQTADRLREALRKGKRIVVRARARARNYAGRIYNATGVIPGRDRREEIIVVGHVYELGANDNASGAGCMLELARTLVTLLRRRAIPRLRRSIRFIFPWECYGSLAYILSPTARRHRALAGVNPDMVGNDQCLCGSVMEISRAPDCCPSPANALLDRLFRALSEEDATYRWHWTGPAGDDGLIYADPSVGAATPTLTMWPDRFYHSSQDTMDKVSPRMLLYGGLVMGTYAALLAAAGVHEALWLADQTYRWSRKRIEDLAEAVIDGESTGEPTPHTAAPAERLAFLCDRGIEHIRASARFVPESRRPALRKKLARLEETLKADAASAARRIETLCGSSALGCELPRTASVSGAELLPRRLLPGYPSFAKLSPAERKAFSKTRTGGLPGGVRGATLLYLSDGRHSIAEINAFLRGETGSSNLRHLVNTFRLLERFGYVKLHRPDRSRR